MRQKPRWCGLQTLKVEIPFAPRIVLCSIYSDERYVGRFVYKSAHFHMFIIAENWKLPEWLKKKKFK